tara:strand:+ start:132 stop:326 length:195 start_codon:yes stop_codon:yes gene_type:complete
MNIETKNSVTQFDPLGIFNLNIQSELYAKELLNGESVINELLLDISSSDLTNTECINKADDTIQ